MKKFKKKLILAVLIVSYTITSSGCNFIVKNEPVEVNAAISEITAETADPDSESFSESGISSSSEIDSEIGSENDSEQKSDSESKKDSEKETDSSEKSSSDTSGTNRNKNSESSKSETSGKVTGISLDVNQVSVNVGETIMPKVTFTPSNASNKGEIWTSSDEKIATVSKDGLIKGIAAGKCTVTVTSAENSKISSTVNVTVTEKKKPKVTDITLSFYEATMTVGQSVMPTVTMIPWNADTLEEIWKSNNEAVATVNEKGVITARAEGTCTITVTAASDKSISRDIKIIVESEEKIEEEEDDPRIERDASGAAYINGILIVNKKYALPSDYNPGGLTSECAQAFEELRKGAADDDINLFIVSGFRSYETQRELYNGYVNTYGQEVADTFSARPGHSEHQAGLAIDCNNASDSFIGTPEAEWLAENCWDYGFIIRYPQGKESITGYKYEPWHIRYVGYEFAQEIRSSGLTIEEYFDI